jgi:two-component system nitrogen regulation response regulator NtrX
MSPGPKILLVDDDPAILASVAGLLADEGYRTVKALDAQAARDALKVGKDAPVAIVLDIRMPKESGLDFLESMPKPLPLPVIVLSGEASVNDTVRALKLGATDFVEKPPSAERLLTAIRNALRLVELSEEGARLRQELAQPGKLIGASSAMEALRETVARVGPTPSLILIRGETGSGKERVARALHLASKREGRFVAINCAAIPAALLESELFGYEKGAFSGAASRRLGRVEQANRGTLLLDVIGDMPPELQAKLLRVLDVKEIERLGGNGPIAVDVRVLAATHQDLEEAVSQRKLREDLFYRLNVFPIVVPPLRDRVEDIEPLLRAFATDFCGTQTGIEITENGLRALKSYHWPGNVRELRNFAERCSLLRTGDTMVIDTKSVAPLKPAAAPAQGSNAPPLLGKQGYRELVEDFERKLLGHALTETCGNVAEAARLLQVDRGNLYRRIKALAIDVESFDKD